MRRPSSSQTCRSWTPSSSTRQVSNSPFCFLFLSLAPPSLQDRRKPPPQYELQNARVSGKSILVANPLHCLLFLPSLMVCEKVFTFLFEYIIRLEFHSSPSERNSLQLEKRKFLNCGKMLLHCTR